jgi:hypothetical protein
MATSDIEIGISVESLADHFLISPNALHRGEGEYAVLTLHERGMLSAMLTLRPSNGKRWNTSRSGINALAPELGRDKISAILKGLRDKRYLYTRRVNLGAGRFRWEWKVFMKACPEGFDPFAGEIPTIDGTAVDGESANGDEQPKDNVSAGHTIDGSIGPMDPSLKEEVPVLRSTKKETPLPPTPPVPAIEPGPTTTGGEDPETDEETQSVESAIRHQPDWRPAMVRAAVRQAITNGLPAPVAYRVIVDLAKGDVYGPTTAGPQRIIAKGPWWIPGAVFVPSSPKGTKTDCERHPGQPGGSCACCAGERRGVIPTGPTIAPATSAPAKARDLFAQIPALRRARSTRLVAAETRE